ncbi:suppressor of lurcher protein 1-like isoform X1 [Mya arenaria]|uniref:suppressor of lurcher protein 1-like isoform X1 n=1 Tax=Mya arenaria TaxID=6604 RepID=UPI0022E75709|nr:suppressor of lurcher protein 1-like isoform X1 [Mya arenaria]
MLYWYEALLLYIVYIMAPSSGIDPSKEACNAFDSDYYKEKACECVVFQSLGLSHGHFHSPNYPNRYRPGLHCILYTFIGDMNEIVEIKFLNMDLKKPETRLAFPIGTETGCSDRIRIYKNLDRPEVNEDSRYEDEVCGTLADMDEKKFFSSGRALILEFHTDPNSMESHSGFKGVFTFLEKKMCAAVFSPHLHTRCTGSFKTDGILQYGTQCTYDIQSTYNHTSGKFFSPRYPQKYPQSSNCRYIFMGQESEKVKVIFRIIRLPKHISSCDNSEDVIKVYDGANDSAKLIKQFCDTHNHEEIYSSGPYMYVEFMSDDFHEKQGFAAEFQFVDASWTDPISSPSDGESVRISGPEISKSATEVQMYVKEGDKVEKCNESFVSKPNKKSGTILSPNHPRVYQPGIICQYEFEAAAQERIQLKISKLDLYYSGGDPYDPYGCSHQDSLTVFIYIDNKEVKLIEFCGRQATHPLMSNGPRMKVVFKSESSQKDSNSGFQLDYSFRTDFGVQSDGEQDDRKECTFIHDGLKIRNGTFTSPNYPGLYPRNTICEYIFHGVKKSNEKVQISFANMSLYGFGTCDDKTDSDSVSFSNFLNTVDRKLPKYCGQRPSYPSVTSEAAFFRVTFRSNAMYDANGFKANFRFIKDVVEQDTPSTTFPNPEPIGSGARLINGNHSLIAIATLIYICLSVIPTAFDV